MTSRALPASAYALFEAKGAENAARVRRINALIASIYRDARDWSGLTVLDLGCGEGLFAIEAALHGAAVTAIDARSQRMSAGQDCAQSLPRLRFIQADVRSHPFEDEGPFDVVLFLGLLYHLDAPDLFSVIERVARATTRALILETHVALSPEAAVERAARTYRGWRYREHANETPLPEREARLRASLDNSLSFWLTPASLFELLADLGFSSVFECRWPDAPREADDRVTLLAQKGDVPPVLTFPWIEGVPEHEVRARICARVPSRILPPYGGGREDTVTDVIVTLGSFARVHPEFVLGRRDFAAWHAPDVTDLDVGLWLRSERDACVGKLASVPAALAVHVAVPKVNEPALVQDAVRSLDHGRTDVWLLFPETNTLLAISPSGLTRVTPDDPIPAPSRVPNLNLRGRDLFPHHRPIARSTPSSSRPINEGSASS